MTTDIVPFQADVTLPQTVGNLALEPSHRQFHASTYADSRASVLDALRAVPSLVKAAKGLHPETLYALRCIPEGGILHRDQAGLVKAVFYKDNAIVQHARLQEIKPSLVKALQTAGSQILLIHMAVQIAEIQASIKQLSLELHYDRIAEVESGCNQFEQAILLQDPTSRKIALHNAMQTLSTGVAKCLRSMEEQIRLAPSPTNKVLDNWGRAKASVAKEYMGKAEQLLQAAGQGIRYTCEAYASLGEPTAANECLSQFLRQVHGQRIAEAMGKARIVPKQGSVFPEQFWITVQQGVEQLLPHLDRCKHLTNDSMPAVEIELRPSELLGEGT